VIAWDAYQEERRRLKAVPTPPKRRPALALVGRQLARLTATLPRIRTAAFAVGGFGLLSAAAWTVAVPLGLAAAGLSLLVLEYLSGEERRR
jgi:hypothetical protein